MATLLSRLIEEAVMVHVKSEHADIVVRHPSPGLPDDALWLGGWPVFIVPAKGIRYISVISAPSEPFCSSRLEIVRHKGGA
jgi:hypothetical protein